MKSKLQNKILDLLTSKGKMLEFQLVNFFITQGYCKPYIESSVNVLMETGEIWKIHNVLEVTAEGGNV